MKTQMKTQVSHSFAIAKRLAVLGLVALPILSFQQPLRAKYPVQTPAPTATARMRSGMAAPVLPPLTITPTPLPGETPLPTVTVDPKDPMRRDAHYVAAKAALESLTFTFLPVQRDANLHAFRFSWDAGWVPPDLSNIPSMIYLPGGISYMLKFHVVLRQPNDPLGKTIDRYPLSGKNEITVYDSELTSGEWEWAVRGEYLAGGGWKISSNWSDWQTVTIQK